MADLRMNFDRADPRRDTLIVNTATDFEKALKDYGLEPVDMDVDVDDQGNISATWITLNHSSNVEAIAYNPVNKRLLVAFRRKHDREEMVARTYQYFDVPEDVYDDLFSAGSPGGTVWAQLRDKYSYNRL